jgi:hypothetical protein
LKTAEVNQYQLGIKEVVKKGKNLSIYKLQQKGE